MIWMRNEAEVLGSSGGAMGRRKDSVQVHVRFRQAERLDSIIPPDMNPYLSKRSFLPLSLRQDVSTTSVENNTNKTKYSQ